MDDDLGETRKLIVIVGFMGSGKTTIARELARLLECRSIDLDELISEREHRSPGVIIEQSGEEEFRRIETETLRQVLEEQSGDHTTRIISLGGGAWTIETNRDLIGQHKGLTVWLNAPFELCWQRIKADFETRPLAQTEAMAAKLFGERAPIYEMAELEIVISETMSATEIAGKIA